MFNPLIAFKNSCNGLLLAWTDDASFRRTTIQFIIGTSIATALGLYNGWHPHIWLMLVAALFPMMIAETINTAIEAVTDKASPEKHPLAKKAKDIGSAAVLLCRIFAALCWFIILIDRV